MLENLIFRAVKAITFPHCNTKNSIFQAMVKQNPMKSATLHWHVIWHSPEDRAAELSVIKIGQFGGNDV